MLVQRVTLERFVTFGGFTFLFVVLHFVWYHFHLQVQRLEKMAQQTTTQCCLRRHRHSNYHPTTLSFSSTTFLEFIQVRPGTWGRIAAAGFTCWMPLLLLKKQHQRTETVKLSHHFNANFPVQLEFAGRLFILLCHFLNLWSILLQAQTYRSYWQLNTMPPSLVWMHSMSSSICSHRHTPIVLFLSIRDNNRKDKHQDFSVVPLVYSLLFQLLFRPSRPSFFSAYRNCLYSTHQK